MKVDKDYRITLPDKNFRNHKVGEFVKVTVQKDESRVYFYLRVPKKCPSRTNRQVRRKLPTDLVEKLNVQLGDELKLVKVERTANQKQNQFNGNSFDLLSLRIEGIMQDPFTRDNEDWIRLWSSSKRGGITKQVELKRYIPINRGTGELFGLMQAESSKGGKRFDFTNKFINEHELFVGVCEQLGIARSQWSFGVIHNPNMRELDIKQVKETFAQNLGLDMNRCYTTKSKTLTSFACSIAINSTILGKVMNKTLKILRKETTRKIKDDKNFDDFCKGFIIKYILGDGTVSINRTCSNLLMVLSEKDQQSKNDFQRILKAYNITSTVAGIKVSISTSFNAVIFFLENNIFVGHAKNRRKVLEYFTSNYFTNILYTRLKSASEWITIEGFSRRNDINYGAGSQSLIRYRARGYVLSKKDRKRTVFQTTKKGEDFINLVDKINL